MRPPAMRGIVTVVVVLGAPRAMAQAEERAVPVEEGLSGK